MLRIEGYVIVSADGMLADASHVMPDVLKFKGDHAFFTEGLDRADVIVHGRNSFEDQPNSPRRKRIWVTQRVKDIAPDPDNAKAVLWNPAGASFEGFGSESSWTMTRLPGCSAVAHTPCHPSGNRGSVFMNTHLASSGARFTHPWLIWVP